MAKAWREVMASPQYQALGAAEREAARNQYFQEVIAPQAGDQAELARRQFDAQYGPKKTTARPKTPPVSSNPTDGMGFAQKALAGAGKAYMDTYRGVKQLGTELGKYAVDSNSLLLGKELHGKMSGALGQSLRRQQAEIDESKKTDEALMNTGAGLAGNVLGYASSMVLPGAAARGTLAARALMPATVAGNVVQGAVLGGMQPVATGENRLANAALGGAVGGAASAVGRGAALVANRQGVRQGARDIYNAAQQQGIRLTPAQLSDSRFIKYAQSMLRSVPFTGAQARHAAQLDDFTRAVSRTIGEDADRITPDVFDRAVRNNGARFNALSQRNNLFVDVDLAGRLAEVQRQANTMAGNDTQNAVGNVINRILQQSENGVLPGRAYQSLNHEMSAPIGAGGESSHYLRQLRDALRDGMDRSIVPADQAEWALARRTHGNLRTIRDLVSKSEEGIIPPPQLLGRVNANNASKEAMARGNSGQLGELARIGQRIKEPPSSGTAERTLVSTALGGGAALDPVIGGGTFLGLNALSRALDSQSLARFMVRNNPGMTLRQAERIIRRSAVPSSQAAVSHNGQ